MHAVQVDFTLTNFLVLVEDTGCQLRSRAVFDRDLSRGPSTKLTFRSASPPRRQWQACYSTPRDRNRWLQRASEMTIAPRAYAYMSTMMTKENMMMLAYPLRTSHLGLSGIRGVTSNMTPGAMAWTHIGMR